MSTESREVEPLIRLRLLIPLVLLSVTILAASFLHPAKAAGDTLYFSPSNVAAPGSFPTDISFNLTADTLGTGPSSGINGWDILVNDSDPTMANLNPVSVSITGNLLAPFGLVSELINCINGGVGLNPNTPGNIGCTSADKPGLVHTSAVLLGPATPAPVSGLMAKITYQALGPGPLNITITTQNISDGSPTPVPHTTLNATYGTPTTADFSITTKNPAPFNPGPGSFNVTLTSLSGFTDVMAVTADVYPASGLTVACGTPTPNPLTPAASSISTCKFNSTIPGTYIITVNATGTTLSPRVFHLAPITIIVGDFKISANPLTVNFLSGGTGTTTVTLTSVNQFNATVNLKGSTVTGLTTSCPSAKVNASRPATSTCSFSSKTPGTFTVIITGNYSFTGGSVTHILSITVNVGDFTISATTPPSFGAGYSGSTTVTLTPKFNFRSSITLTATTTPTTGLTVDCGTQPISVTVPTNRPCSLTSTTPGSYSLNITGTTPLTGGPAHFVVVTVTVNPDFTITSATPVVANVAADGNSTITVIGYGFSATVTFTVSSSGLSCGTPAAVTSGSGTSILSCSASTTGNYTATVTGSSGTLSHTTGNVAFRIVDFTSAASPTTISLNIGSSASTTLTLTSTNGFASGITLTSVVSNNTITNRPGALFSNATVTNVPTMNLALTSGSQAAVTLSITAAAVTPAGTYTVNVTATSGTRSHNVLLTITITNAPSITVTSIQVSTSSSTNATSATTGDKVTIVVGVTNSGASDANFAILVKWGIITVAQANETLKAGQSNNYTLTWDTANYGATTQTISVTVPPLSGQSNTSGSTLTGRSFTLNSAAPPLLSGTLILIIGVGLALLVVAVVAVLLLRMRRKTPVQ